MRSIKTIILCGGIGYRLKEETEFKPKPMVEIGGKPILWHIMKIYASFGFRDFIIALGYKGNLIKDYFINKKYYDGDFTLKTINHRTVHHNKQNLDNFRITFVDTGLDSLTGERVRRVERYVDGENFMLTYGDGLANINIKDLLIYHLKMKKVGTVTGVHPMLRYGDLRVSKDGLALYFNKRSIVKNLINGGFMIFKKSVFGLIKPNSMIEDVFSTLIRNNQLAVYKHDKFFHAMDTYQDMQDLNEMWRENPAWKIWG